jgi:carboxypeptidase A4
VYDVAGGEYSIAFELRSYRDTGFVLPPRFIRPTGEEMWAGIRYLLLNM